MEIVQEGPFKVVGLKVVARWEDLWREMPRAWGEFLARHGAVVHRLEPVFVDVSLGKSGELYTQVVGSRVGAFEDVPPGMVALEIPAQRYVRYRHAGPVEGIALSFGRMYAWAKDNGLEADEFKLDIGYTADGAEQEHELFVRVKP